MMIVRTFDSGFPLAHDTYNGMGAGSDGRIYYVLSSERHDTAGQMFVFDPSAGQLRHLGDLSQVCGEKGKHVIAQAKSHVNFVESDGKLYFETHIGYYSLIDDMEKMGIPPEGSGRVSWRAFSGVRSDVGTSRGSRNGTRGRRHPDHEHGPGA